MFCRTCGNELKEGMIFCGKCGTPVNVEKNSTPSTPKQVESVRVVKERKPILSKEVAVKIGIGMILLALYIGISMLFIWLLKMEDTIVFKTQYNKDVCAYLTLDEFLNILLNGTKIFYPTIASTAIAIGVYVLIYSIPAFAFVAFIGAIVRKKSSSLHVVFTIMSILTASILAVVTPITMKFIPIVKQAIAKNSGIILEDMKGVAFTKLVVFVAILLIMIVASCIVTGIYNKRRAKA